ncbi:hypothetical protein FB645_005393, partial [Coemansia sp. IMI 203386]
LRQRLDEVLEDNTRLSALLDDAQNQIKQLRDEKDYLANKLIVCNQDSTVPLHERHISSSSLSSIIALEPHTCAKLPRPSDCANLSNVSKPGCSSKRSLGLAGVFEVEQRTILTPRSAPASMVVSSTASSAVGGSNENALCERQPPRTNDVGQATLSSTEYSKRLPSPLTASQQQLFVKESHRTDIPVYEMQAPMHQMRCSTISSSNFNISFGVGDNSGGSETGFSQQQPVKRRKRHHDIGSKVRSVQPVPRDKDGNYEMPVQVGILTVLNLGKIVWDQDSYHNERYIWPVGYTVQREYYSMKDPDQQVIYTCWITDSGDAPLFHVEAEDMVGSPIAAPTATGAWTMVLRAVNQIRQREHSNSASGPDYFGFSHPTIAKMIQDLPGADRCRSYIMQHFVEMKDRHVRGVIKKGRGGRPSTDMLSRGQRALMASSSTLPHVETKLVGEKTASLQTEFAGTAKRISVTTLTNNDE